MKLLVLLVVSFNLLLATVDINSASVDELSSLKGVGASKAKAIIKHRSRNCFKNIDELSNVKGIGVKTIEKNKDNLSVGTCK